MFLRAERNGLDSKSGAGFGEGTVTCIDDEASDCVKDEED